ncbi:hypothetical protein C1637_11305 [Chryseobacterium lactis]|uniref:ComEC family competence protein n=1 Tax=Chryseobacterium lactis TaxID=1241981 RepID=A0A3G6RVG9_CHRLC|nr:ComEC/Rec2 family competence protein [Chryseobacterium lactis]AZA80874.1 ComEC family competence protein [Chryseobacterium lactis]AZB05876.1 ComEC family competence protein [Chryseobacterium lactis]PNW13405.1 hypothetical protein C1637_11305 [Chryseobacterium lactis]
MNKQPLLILALCFILGILFQDSILLGRTSVCIISLIGVGILASMFFQSYFLHKIRVVLLGLLFFGIGIILHFYNTFPSQTTIFTGKGTVVFTISQKLNSSEKYKKYVGTAQVRNHSFSSVFYVSRDHKELDFNHYYKAKAYITAPQAPQYDFQFDYAHYLKRKGIGYQSFLINEITSAEKDDVSFVDKVRQNRLEVLLTINQTGMSTEAKEFLKGIILADRTEMNSNTVQDFNRSGLVHLLAISGSHIVIIFGMFYFLMTRIIPVRLRKYVIVASLGFIWLFAMFIGFGNSVLRACLMLSIYFIFILLQRKPDLLHSMALSAFVILMLDTQQLFDVGFQLSFLAVLGIFWLNQPLLRYFPNQDSYFKKLIFNTITISLSAQLATLPLVLYYFHQFSLISIIANFIIVPFSEVIIVFSFLMTVFISFNIDFEWINIIYDFVIQVLLKIIHWFAERDMLFFENIPMSLIEVFSALVMVYLLRFVILKLNFKNYMRLTIAFLLFLTIRMGCNTFSNQREESLSINFQKSKIFAIKKGDEVCFWIPDIADNGKVLQFLINPYCSSRRIRHFEIKTIPSSAQKIVFMNRIYDLK